jgi:hypothetical protein
MFKAPPIQSVIDMRSINLAQILQEEKLEEGLSVPFRFGVDIDVNYTLENSGKWFEKEDGRVWKLKIRSKGAYSINLIFDLLYLPEGTMLYIYNEEKTMLYGPITSQDISDSGVFGTDLIQGSTITLELFETIQEKVILNLQKSFTGIKIYLKLLTSMANHMGVTTTLIVQREITDRISQMVLL